MADKKISALTTLAQADVAVTADFLPIVDTSATETKKATPSAIVNAATTAGQVPFSAGSAATPSIAPTGDSNTGIYFPAADTIAFVEGGVEAMRLDSSGNLGIGTASPAVKLQVANSNILLSNAYYLSSRNAANTLSISMIGRNASDQVIIDPDGYGTLIGSGGALGVFGSGNVGIGTASPTALLDVNANTMRLRTARTPASATAAGNAGDICWDATYLYICTATNTWRRILHATW